MKKILFLFFTLWASCSSTMAQEYPFIGKWEVIRSDLSKAGNELPQEQVEVLKTALNGGIFEFSRDGKASMTSFKTFPELNQISLWWKRNPNGSVSLIDSPNAKAHILTFFVSKDRMGRPLFHLSDIPITLILEKK